MGENKIMNLFSEEDVLRMLRSFHTSEINVQLSMAKLSPIKMENKLSNHIGESNEMVERRNAGWPPNSKGS